MSEEKVLSKRELKQLEKDTKKKQEEATVKHAIPIPEGPKFVWSNGKKAKPELIARSLRSLVMILRAGGKQQRALEIVGKQFEKYNIGQVYLKAAKYMLESGAEFKQAILHDNEVLPKIAKSLILAAPTADALTDNLLKAADQVTNNNNVKKKLINSMIQPGIMLTMAIGFLFFGTAYIIPGFADTFTQLGVEEPELSLVVKEVAVYVQWSIIGLMAVIISFIMFWFLIGRRNPKMVVAFSRFGLKMPLLGPILQITASARLLEMLAINLSMGDLEPKALRSAGLGCGNEALKAHCLSHADKMETEGVPLKEFADIDMIPLSARYLLQTAPSTGDMVKIMEVLAPELTAEASTQVDGFQKTIEPIMTYIVYAIVGVLIISIVLPMYSIYPALMEFGDNVSG